MDHLKAMMANQSVEAMQFFTHLARENEVQIHVTFARDIQPSFFFRMLQQLRLDPKLVGISYMDPRSLTEV